jgi:glycosyltransferase
MPHLPLNFLDPPPSLASAESRVALPGRISGGLRARATNGQAVSHRPRVSIITVVRNAASTIERTIQSVLSQKAGDVEYVVVDGGSTDGTLDLLRAYDDRLSAWISEPDRGIADALNKGIGLTTGEIIGILHADDRYLPGAIAASVAALNADPIAGFSYGHLRYMDADKPAFVIRGDPRYADIIERRMPSLNHPTTFVRRRIYERFGLFRANFRISMDYDFFLRLHLGGVRSVLLPQVLAEMRLGGLSMTDPVRGHWECLVSSLDQGRPAGPAAGAFALSTAGALARLALERAGAHGVVAQLRRLRAPVER